MATNMILTRLLLFLFCYSEVGSFRDKPDELLPAVSTIKDLCHAQCLAKCEDRKKGLYDHHSTEIVCSDECIHFLSDDWIRSCGDSQRCVYSCNNLNNETGIEAMTYIPSKPNMTLHQVVAYSVNLTWTESESTRPEHAIYYVLEQRDGYVEDDHPWSSTATISDQTSYSTNLDCCTPATFRVASVNQYGTRGFSRQINRYEFPIPGQVSNREESYSFKRSDFYFRLHYDPPQGWLDKDIWHYSLDRSFVCFCDHTGNPPKPTAQINKINDDPPRYEIRIKVDEEGYGCVYYSSVVAHSACEMGEAYYFAVNLTDCNRIANYTCPEANEEPPGPVRNLTADVIPDSKRVLIRWLPPLDLGTSGNISSYVVQWGLLRYFQDVPSHRLEEESRETVEYYETELEIEVNSTNVEYGVKVVAISGDEDNHEQYLNRELQYVQFMIESDGDQDGGDESANNDEWIIYIVVPVLLIVVGCLATLMGVLYRRRKKEKKDEGLWSTHLFTSGQDSSGLQKQLQRCMVENPFYNKQNTSDDLTPQVTPDQYEIPRSYLVLGEVLGRGAFGQVVKGRLSLSGLQATHETGSTPSSSSSSDVDQKQDEIDVAVKMLLDYSGDSHRQDFLKEIELMKQIGTHPSVVSIIGCCTQMEPLCLVVEHVPHGDLLHYLRSHRHRLQKSDDGAYTADDMLTWQNLLSFARQIAVGMEFLSQKGFVHRDLATRNTLVGEDNTVKIGDFGLTRYIYDDKIYVTKKGGKLPIKWMAIEAIFDLTFTTASDVWSFGVVLFELVTLGGTPYPTITNKDLLKELRRGYRMERPENCTEELYELMLSCWQERPSDRPSFSDLRDSLDLIFDITSPADYICMNADQQTDYYRYDDYC